MADMIEVSLWRGKEEGRYQTFQVPQRENQTVLDIVTWVQRNADPTLSYRFACRVGMCGSCAMTVNGRPRWTCRTHTSKVVEDGKLEIGPLANLPVIKDLAADMAPLLREVAGRQGRVCAEQDARRSDREDFADERAARGCRCGHRMHQLRGVLCGLRYGALERGLPGTRGAQPRVDARQRCEGCRQQAAACGDRGSRAAATPATRTRAARSTAPTS